VAVDLKKAGNGAYGSKDYNRAIELYTRAIACKADPIFYSNRAACYNALGEWERVVEDTTAALNLDPEYVKALNRRAHAYEKLQRHSDALLDYTASCIIDGFKDPKSAEAVEHLLQEIAQQKAKEMMRNKTTKLGSPTFVGNYLHSFRDKPRPAALADEVVLDENTGKGQLQLGLRAMERKTSEGYEEASTAFERALELGDLGESEALAYNLRGTFLCLMGKHDESLKALDRSIELDPSMTQSYIKRASMKLETGETPRYERPSMCRILN
jgi:mitochondrial import receptor subunit TOM70